MLRFCAAAIAVALVGTRSAIAQDSTARGVAAIQVHLFHTDSGLFDAADLLDPQARPRQLLNVDSPAILILVGVEGAFSYDSLGSLQLSARLDDHAILQREVHLRSFLYSKDGRIWIPFVAYGTLCGQLTIRAQLLRGGHALGTLSKSLQFYCGE